MKYKACEKCAKNVGKVNIIGNILMIVIKGYLGVVGRSKALIADAIHSSADLLATIIMIIGLNISDQNPDEEYPYGYGKAEYIVAIIIYLVLLGVGSFIVVNGVTSIIKGHTVTPCISAIWGAVFSIAINELMFRQSVCAGKQTNRPSMVAKAWESRSDVYSSFAVLIGIIGAKMGFTFMDPLAAIVVGFVILKVCIEMLQDSVLQLMDKAVDENIIDKIEKTIGSISPVTGIKNIFSRELGQFIEIEVEVFVSNKLTVSEGEKIKNSVNNAINKIIEKKSIIKTRLYTQ